MGIVHITPVHP